MTRNRHHALAIVQWLAFLLKQKRLQQVLLLLCIFGATELPAVGQIIGNPQSAVDNLMRSNLKVDPSTGALQLQIPLGEYRGRGDASLPIALNYSSKLWTIKHLSTLPCNGEPVSSYYAEYAKGSASGWMSSVGWFLPTEDLSLETYEGQTQKPATVGNPYLWRIMRRYVRLPDGSRHEMRRDEGLHTFGENQSGVYYSVDGSRMWWDWTDSATNTLYLPNGSRMVTTSGTRQYIDRNGNVLTYNNSTSTWSDTVGRSFGVPVPGSPPGVGYFNYALPGVNGTSLNYTLHWVNLGNALTDPSQPLRYKGDAPTSDCTLGGPQPNTLFSTMDAQRKILKQTLFNPIVLSEIILPNGTKYTFTYNVWGEITKVVYPTGGNEQFAYEFWEPLGGQLDDGTTSQANRGVLYRTVSDGVNPAQIWSYNGNVFETGVDPATAAKSFTGPDGTRTVTWYYKSRGPEIKYGFDDARTGMTREVRVFNSSGAMLRRTVSQLAEDGPLPGGYSTATRNARVTKTVEIILDTGGNALAAATEMTYDSDLNVTITKQYDYVSISQTTGQTGDIPSIPNGTLLRTSETDYLTNNPSYRARNLLSLPTATRTKNGAGTIVAQSSFSYDEAGYPLLPCGASTWIDPATTARGNATTAGSWLNTTGTYLQSHAQYDQCGSVRYSWDAKGNQSQVQYSSTYAYAYPTYTQTAVPDPTGQYGSNIALVTTGVYDFNTGLITSITDPNNVITTFEYNDSLNHLTRTVRASGAAGQSQSAIAYDYVNRIITTTSDLNALNDNLLKSQSLFDGLGRLIERRQYEGGTNYISVQTQFDTMGRAYKSSNPFRPWQSEVALWTTTGFDALSRVLTVTTPDSAAVSSSYSGNTVTVTDQIGKARKSVTDALGRMKEVYEDPSGLNYLTSYSYDTLDNLTTVTQGTQTRTFVYDSLKRLTSATNPESGAISYTYDNNSNLLTKTDARGVVSTYGYDALNRNTTIMYTNDPNATLPVSRVYDFATNGKGRLYKSQTTGTAGSLTTIDSYDALGRPLTERQQFFAGGVWSASYTTQRAYNLAGGVTSQTYPSGRTVAYSYDSAGRTSSFSGYLGDGVNRTYSTAILYSPFGGMTKEQFGTDTAIYNKLFYNSRGQLSEIRDSTSWTGPTDTTWNRGAIINFNSTCWGMCGGSNSNTPMTDNNGNLKRQEVYIPNDDQISSYVSWAQTYDYDSLNRLQRVIEGSSWQQEYVYDRYGNRTIHQTNTWGTGINKKDFTVNTGNNRLGVPGGQSGVMSYDNAGNLTNDTYTGAGTRTYDAENRMSTAWGGNNQSQVYTYNADGQRARRKVDGVETWQIYGMDGELVAEYAQSGATGSPQKEYGYRNGQLLLTAGGSLPVFSDDFNGASLDTSKWTIADPNSTAVVSQTGQRLQIALPPNTAVYNGVSSNSTFNLTDRNVQVELAQPISQAGWCENFLQVALDGSNYFLIDAGAGSMVLRSTVNGVNDQTIIPTFDSALHHYWRIRHNPSGNTINFETSADGTSWTTRKTVTVGFSLTNLRFYLYAGAWGTGNSNPGAAKYDNFQLVENSAAGLSVQWLVTDQLGTPRMVFDKSGALATVKRHDYLPFGEELFAGTGARTSGLGYAADNVRQKFTQKERDNETGLDYFLARYYSSTQGRFTSPDEFQGGPYEFWLLGKPAAKEKQALPYGDIKLPQSLNKYQYCYNNPQSYIDPDGRDALLVTDKDTGETKLVIPVNFTGKGATPELVAAIVNRANQLDTGGSGVKIEVVSTDKPINGVLNNLDLSPGLDKKYPPAGEGVDGLGGNKGHINTATGGADGAAAHDVLHFAGIKDQYKEGDRDANGQRTSIPTKGYDNSNIMTSRGGTKLKPEQITEAQKNRSTKKCTTENGKTVCK